MKKILLLAILLLAAVNAQGAPKAPPPGYCEVKICNKLERFTLSPWSAIKDKVGEQCMVTVIAKEDAVEGKELSSESRWYQGSEFNPTKKSVTRVNEVRTCTK